MSNIHRHFRNLGLILVLVFGLSSFMTTSAQEATSEPQAASVYTDPQDYFTAPVPQGWTDTSTPGYGQFTHENGSVLSVGALPSDEIDAAKALIINMLAPELVDVPPTQTADIPLPTGVWTQDLYLLDEGPVTALITTYKEGIAYFLIVQAPDLATTGAITPDLNQTLLGFTIGEPIDLTTATAAPLTDEDLAALDTYITGAVERFGIPGTSVAVVQNGKVVFSKGYGVISLETRTEVNADTLFMIGSTTKSMTSFAAATLVDEGKLDWDQPATDLLPDFALSDADATSQIRYRDLLNMTSGIPRYDTPLFLEEAEPERILAMVAEPDLVAQPGETFNYNNQMVALGGFAAAVADGGTFGPDIDDAYAQLLQERVLDPIGMTRSTLDPVTALADENHATSYTLDVTQTTSFAPIDPSFERFASPVAPAGALWSSANDMGRYLITQINLGVTPEGTRIVSEDNLQETHTPAISMGPSSYGMGWMIGTWNGLTLLEHGGGTVGFVSDFSYLEDAKLGVVVLASSTGSSFFTAAVREYVYELAYGLEHTADERFIAADEITNAAMLQGLDGIELKMVDKSAVTDYLGTYTHGVDLVYDEGLFVETAYGRLPLYDIGQEGRYLVGGSLVGFGVELTEKDGQYSLTAGSLTDSTQSITVLKE